MKRPTVLGIALVALLAQPASADSDGYFCAGPDYLAYQFGLAAPPVAPHQLFIVRLGDHGGISEPVAISLPQFQVHGMRCRDRAVDILAFDSLHTVTFDEAGQYLGRTAVATAGEMMPPWSAASRNLAGLSAAARELQPERHTLRTTADGRRFVLEIEAARGGINECATAITARIVEFDTQSRVLNARIVYEGPGYYDSCLLHHPQSVTVALIPGPPSGGELHGQEEA
jgi:hypothetical protein